jgi:RHS repeat-associated protein
MDVYSYYEASSGYGTTNAVMSGIISQVAGALVATTGGVDGGGIKTSGVNSAFSNFGAGANQGDTQPAAFINYILFDLNYKVMDAGWQVVPAGSFSKQHAVIPTITVKEAGYIFTYLSYEDQSNNYVYFDNFNVTITPTNNVIQSNEYYPFGLQTANSWTRDNNSNNFLYNEGSELNNTSGLYDLPYRNYDAALGRFHQIDPLAHVDHSTSPFAYAGNNPIAHNDPSGLLWARTPDPEDQSGDPSGYWSEDDPRAGGRGSIYNGEGGDSGGGGTWIQSTTSTWVANRNPRYQASGSSYSSGHWEESTSSIFVPNVFNDPQVQRVLVTVTNEIVRYTNVRAYGINSRGRGYTLRNPDGTINLYKVPVYKVTASALDENDKVIDEKEFSGLRYGVYINDDMSLSMIGVDDTDSGESPYNLTYNPTGFSTTIPQAPDGWHIEGAGNGNQYFHAGPGSYDAARTSVIGCFSIGGTTNGVSNWLLFNNFIFSFGGVPVSAIIQPASTPVIILNGSYRQ